MQIEVEVGYDDNGESIMKTLPAKFVVCGNCNGHGTVVIAGMRGYCYTQDEFNDAFDDEDDRAAYFKRGGKYDVQCPTCKGKNVVKVVDDDACVTDEQKAVLKAHEKWSNGLWRSWEEDRMTMRGESGIFD